MACPLGGLVSAAAPFPALKVSDNKRFLVTPEGQPFFWLSDTTWELSHWLNRENAIKLFENRAARKFNVLQSVAIAELEGHTDPNPYGHLPFVDLDVTNPAVKDGPQNDYWDHVDFIVTARPLSVRPQGADGLNWSRWQSARRVPGVVCCHDEFVSFCCRSRVPAGSGTP